MSRELARAISALEKGGVSPAAARPPLVIGITGPPGAGKSTVIDAFLGVMDERVAVLAVDPSSPFTGGALLGDRVRMNNAGPDVFIRSLASRGHGGGLAPRMRDVLSLLAAHGYETVLVETVGVGQEEMDVASIADVTVVVLTPAGGDSVQAEKAGLLEAADVLILNKSDLAGAERADRELHEATGLPVARMVAKDGRGAREALELIRSVSRRQRPAALAGFAVDHLGIAVNSIEESLGFYVGVLGMRVMQRETVVGEQVHVAMLEQYVTDEGVTGSAVLLSAAPKLPRADSRYQSPTKKIPFLKKGHLHYQVRHFVQLLLLRLAVRNQQVIKLPRANFYWHITCTNCM